MHYSARVALTRYPVAQPPRTRIEETVTDLVHASASLEHAIAWVTRACCRRLTTPDRLGSAFAARPRLRWRAELGLVLDDTARGCHSVLERRYLERVERRHGLPRARRQAARGPARRRRYHDVRYEPWGLVVELDGRVAHPGELRWRDSRRDNASVASGDRVLRYGWADVTGRPCTVAAEMAAALGAAGWRGTPHRCSSTCALPR